MISTLKFFKVCFRAQNVVCLNVLCKLAKTMSAAVG